MPAVCLSCPETYKPSQLESLTKSTSRKTRKEDGVRLRALNGLLHKALTDLLCTPEVSQELCDLNVELSKVHGRARQLAEGPGARPKRGNAAVCACAVCKHVLLPRGSGAALGDPGRASRGRLCPLVDS